MESKNKRIELYSSFLLGHSIPLCKMGQILKNRERDYDITLITTQLVKRRLENQYRNIKFVGLHPEITRQKEGQTLRSHQNLWKTLFTMFEGHLQKQEHKPDLIIADFFAVGVIKYAKKNGIKLIVNIPNSFQALSGLFNLLNLNRSYNIEGFLINYQLPKHPMFGSFDQIIDSFRGWGRVLFHSFIGLQQAALLPSHHSLIGILPNNSSLQLPNELKDWMDDWKQRGRSKFLYVSFGSILVLSEKFTLKLAEIFAQVGYPVIWSLRSPGRHQIRHDLIYHRQWQPQLPILELPQVRGYMTHCGWGSITEALTTKTPLIGVPIFAEQTFNANLVVKKKIGVKLCNSAGLIPPVELQLQVDNQSIKRSIKELMEDETYYDSVKRLNKLSKIHKTQNLICQIVEETLEFGNQHLICDKYEQATIKTGVPLDTILKQEYVPKTEGLQHH